MAHPTVSAPPPQSQIIARAAAVVMLGNVASRALGLVRETVIADLFGATGMVSAYRTAAVVPTLVYDLLVGGLISAALVPILSGYATRERRGELAQVSGALFTLLAFILAATVLALEAIAPFLASLLGGGLDPDLQAAIVRLTRLILPSIFFFGLSGALTGLLYSRQRFVFPAFGAAAFNLGIILAAVFLAPRLGIAALSWGVVLGAALQLAIQLPGLAGLRPQIGRLWHPDLGRMALLYAPVVLSIVVSQVGTAIDFNLASRTGPQSRAWMQAATYLIQFPLGLVAAGVAIAILPSLSRLAGRTDSARFQRTLATGLRMVLVLILPAAAALLALGKPLVGLIFEHGAFLAEDTTFTVRALETYLIGLPFAAVDQVLIFAFYARKDPRTPVMVGIVSVGIYLLVALSLIGRLGFVGLTLANAAQWAGHALLMVFLTQRRLAQLTGHGIGTALLKAGVAAAAMGLSARGAALWLTEATSGSFLQEALVVAGAGGLGFLIYVILLLALRAQEVPLILDLVRGFRRAPARGS
ncbi:MAG: murein biosynthesis integral membrane protein MurJ [Anaerolineae bacterium]